MSVGALILVEPSLAGNIGAAMRVAANFGVPRLELVRSAVEADDPEVLRWACGADRHLECRRWDGLAEAAAPYRTLAASASGRGRRSLLRRESRLRGDGAPDLRDGKYGRADAL